MGIGPAYRSAAVQAVLGPAHAATIPNVLWPGWLNAAGELIGMCGVSLSHSQFGPVTDGVTNIAVLDLGVASGADLWGLGLFDGETGVGSTQMIASASIPQADPDHPVPLTPTSGDLLSVQVGALVFTLVDPV